MVQTENMETLRSEQNLKGCSFRKDRRNDENRHKDTDLGIESSSSFFITLARNKKQQYKMKNIQKFKRKFKEKQ